MKPTTAYLFLFTAIFFNVLTSTFFKFSAVKSGGGNKGTWLFIVGLVFGFLNAHFYTKSLQSINLNVAYPIFSIGSALVLTVLSYLIFKETVTYVKLGGLVLIVVGLYLINLP